MGHDHIPAPVVRDLLAPLLPSLPAAAFSAQPAPGILRLLSPILRQRVQLFSSSTHEPWLRLLCYDSDKAAALGDVVRNGDLEPHPVSGEVEVDWDYDVETRYRRLDNETLQALVVFKTLGLVLQLVYCADDQEGGDGWRVGEVSVPDKPSPFSVWGGLSSLADAEINFEEREAAKKAVQSNPESNVDASLVPEAWKSKNGLEEEYDDDDDYWDRYDATPARTPAAKQSPPPEFMQQQTQPAHLNKAAEDAYFAQYENVQPAMDNHDPDEVAAATEMGIAALNPVKPAKRVASAELSIPPLGLGKMLNTSECGEPMPTDAEETSRVWTMVEKKTRTIEGNEDRVVDLVHPKPESSASSSGSRMVEKLEASAGRQDQSEFGIKQHVRQTIRSLFSLSRAAGIDREEFERLVNTELDMLGMAENEEHI